MCAEDQRLSHQVEIPGFAIIRYEIMQEVWEALMGDNQSAFGDCLRCPVETVSWNG